MKFAKTIYIFKLTGFIALPSLFFILSQNSYSYTTLGGSISHQNNALGGGIGSKKGNHHFTDVDVDYKKVPDDGFKHSAVFATRYTDANELLLSLPEANLERKFDGDFNSLNTYGGRYTIPWSPLDKTWGLGYLNNRKNLTFYDPGQEGLTGLGFDLKNHTTGLTFSGFVSYIYIPELNPSSKIEDGKVTSKNIWATSPPTKAKINNVDTPIKYYLEQPDLADIIFRPSVGTKIGYDKNNFVFDVYYFLKPENSIRPGGEAKLTTNGDIKANIQAKLYYEELVGSNLSYQFNNFKAYASFFRIDPKNSPANDPLYVEYVKIETFLEKRDYAGFGILHKVSNSEFGINWIALLTKPQGANDLLSNKSRFREAVNLSWSLKLSEHFKNFFDIKFDTMKRDKIIMEEFSYLHNQNWIGTVGFHLLDAPNATSFWAKYRSNDAVFGKVTYVF